MNLKDISTQLLFTTVPIWVDKGEGQITSGTSFIYIHHEKDNEIPFLVTNFHVVKGGRCGVLEFSESENGEPKRGQRVRIEIDEQYLSTRLGNKDVDLVAFPIAPVFNQLKQLGKTAFFRSINSEIIPSKANIENLAALEEITFIGYPSGLFDNYNYSPLIRRGITSTPVWNDFKGESCFLIDAGVFPGSSGSPVFLLNQGSFATQNGITIGNRLFFLGVISETLIHTAKDAPQNYLGLGKVINSTLFQKYIDSVVNDLKNQGRI